MQIKIFTAPRLHEALALVRQGLGADAVVLDRMEGVDEKGNRVWHVHAALDTETSNRHKNDTKKKEHAQSDSDISHVKKMEASMQRLERIVEGLGRKEAESLRHAMSDKSTQMAFDKLVDLGVAPSYAFDLAEDYVAHKPMGASMLHWGERIDPKQKRVVMLLAGPSGAGKTLLAAKLATHYSMRGIRVGLLTTDVNRMGGSEVLKSYADVLGAPFARIRQIKDVTKAMEVTESAQLLLVDTEGWNIHQASSLRQQSEIWDAITCTDRILVMPANMDETDGIGFLSVAESMGIDRLAFTKLDETSRPGKVVNWAMASGLKLSYGGFGTDVAGQMGWLTAQALTSFLDHKHQHSQPKHAAVE